MSRDIRFYLLDVLERCERITRYLAGLDEADGRKMSEPRMPYFETSRLSAKR